MPFSKCRDVMNRVDEVVSGDAGAVAKTRFFAHLAMCPDCTRYYEQYRDVTAAAGTAQAEDLPDDFSALMGSVLDAIAKEPPSEG
jgi:hypothetical protein